MTAEKIAAVDHLDDIAKALTYAAQCLDGVVSMDEEDEGKDGGSATCQSCVTLVNRALGKVEKVRPLLDELDRLKARVAEMEAALEPFSIVAGEYFARNFSRDDVIASIPATDDGLSVFLSVGHLYAARAAYARPLPTKGDANG